MFSCVTCDFGGYFFPLQIEPLGGFRIVHEVMEGDEGTNEFSFHRRSRLQGGTLVTVSTQLCVCVFQKCQVVG